MSDDEEICGLCGEPGADKIAHPILWPTEMRSETGYVHSECEQAETARAHREYKEQVGANGIWEFLRGIK